MTTNNATEVYSQERLTGNSDWFEVLAAQTASEASRTSELFKATRAQGLIIQVIVDAVANTPTFTPTVLVVSGDTSLADEVLASFSAIGSSGSTILVFHPHASGMGDSFIAGMLPSEWKLSLVYSGADTTHVANTHVYARYLP